MKSIKRIVLTGGPCAGKTSALVKVIEHFTTLGYKVFTIPEVPTMFTQAGMDYLTQNKDFFYEGEKATLEIQLALEDKFTRMAETCSEPCVIVCDRGVMDISAYMKPEMWKDITSRLNTNTQELRNRYDAVLHLVSAADGAEQYYTTSNNAQRLEQADEAGLKVARELDKKVIKAWTGHPHLRIVDNSSNFEDKMKRLMREIAAVLGEPNPYEIERKFLIEMPDISYLESLPNCEKVKIVQTYLVSNEDEEVRIRQRGNNGSYTYSKTRKITVNPLKRIEIETRLSQEEYINELLNADLTRGQIIKDRYCLSYKNQYFEIDIYPFWKDKAIAEIELISEEQKIEIPNFLNVIDEVTDNIDYKNSEIARMIKKNRN